MNNQTKYTVMQGNMSVVITSLLKIPKKLDHSYFITETNLNDEGYSKNTSCALNLISTFSLKLIKPSCFEMGLIGDCLPLTGNLVI